jgi:hypothetical protein
VIHEAKQMFIPMACVVVFSLSTATADTCVNGDMLSVFLASGYSCVIGDKTFSDFTYASSSSNAVQVSATGITVDVLDGASAFDPSGDIGLGFNAGWVASGVDSLTSSSIGFTVTVTPGSALLIEDTGVSQLSGVSGDASASVEEDSCGPAPCERGTSSILTFDDGANASRTADTTFTPVASVEVSKSILVESNAATGFAHLSFVADTFSQTVTPEPRGLSLLLGLVVVVSVTRRKKLHGVRT